MTHKIEDATITPRDDRARARYEAPGLHVIGNAADVIRGLPGGGLDGPWGMTEPEFEFELDGDLNL
jgi:hypothetical protein